MGSAMATRSKAAGSARGGRPQKFARPTPPAARASDTGTGAGAVKQSRFHLPDGSRSVQSPFVWRMFVFMSLIALGLGIFLLEVGTTTFAALWLVIALGWFAVGMVLWRRHIKDDDRAYAAGWRGGRKTR